MLIQIGRNFLLKMKAYCGLTWKNISFCSVVDLSHLTSSIPSLQEFPLVCLPYSDR